MIIDIPIRNSEVADRPAATKSQRRRTSSAQAGAREPCTSIPLPRSHWYASGKLVLEYAACVLLALLAAPLVLVAALLVKLTSRGPAFYTQTRVGQHGRLFTIYKIRTMVHECESLTGPRWSIPGDPRITRIGQILRKTHLDELPQLLNVLRGEMGLIGPRPERPEFVPRLERSLPEYRERLRIRPGITGLAQVHFAADTDLESVRKKLSYDLHYIRNLRAGLDLRILIATAFYALGNPRELSKRIVSMRNENVEECRLVGDRNEDVAGRLKRCA